MLESCAGTMEKASSLKYVPLDLRANQDLEPFTLSTRTATSYLSSKYPTWTIEGAKSIGMLQLSPQDFLEDLRSMITHDLHFFRMKSALWHSQLAETLVKLTTNSELLSIMQIIRLIPLHDGTWTSAMGHSIFFSRGKSSLEIPRGIDVLILDSSVESDANRRNLFVALGVKAWETPEICRLILQLHQSTDFDPTTLASDQLISHTAFLYESSWQLPKDADIWFATVQDKRCVGRKLYITGSVEPDSAASRVFTRLRERFAVIHDGYLKAYPSEVGWPLWLVHNLGLSMVPRLITPLIEPKPRPVRTAQVREKSSEDSEQVEVNDLLAGMGIPYKTPSVGGPDTNGSLPRMSVEFCRRRITRLASPDFRPSGSDASPHENISPQAKTHALQDYQMQLMLLEQQNKKRLLMARQEQTSLGSTSDITPLPPLLSPPRDWPDLKPPVTLSAPVAREQDQEKAPAKNDLSSANIEAKTIFTLSEEFLFMFQECDSSDVLQILRDNWTHYSQWIDGAHMEWQDPNFVLSSTRLKTSLGLCEVQSAKGILRLEDLVLPGIDCQLDDRGSIPTVHIRDPQHTSWNFLNFFGVLVKADAHYYLRCLISISGEQCPDIDDVAYIYWKIQTFYKGNEELIRYAQYCVQCFKFTENG